MSGGIHPNGRALNWGIGKGIRMHEDMCSWAVPKPSLSKDRVLLGCAQIESETIPVMAHRRATHSNVLVKNLIHTAETILTMKFAMSR